MRLYAALSEGELTSAQSDGAVLPTRYASGIGVLAADLRMEGPYVKWVRRRSIPSERWRGSSTPRRPPGASGSRGVPGGDQDLKRKRPKEAQVPPRSEDEVPSSTVQARQRRKSSRTVRTRRWRGP